MTATTVPLVARREGEGNAPWDACAASRFHRLSSRPVDALRSPLQQRLHAVVLRLHVAGSGLNVFVSSGFLHFLSVAAFLDER